MAESHYSSQILQHEQQHAHHQGRIRQTFENQLVLDYLDLAEALAARFLVRGRERADLNQVAYLGLVKAARGFDASRGASFPAYAAPTITGELKRYLRDRCWVVRPPRQVQDLRSELLRSEPALAQALGRPPTAAELAQELDVSPELVREAMVAGASLRPDSLDAVDSHSDAAPLGETLPSGEDPLARLEELICLNQAIHELTAEDQELLYRRYFCEESQAELGRRFGVSQMQVSRRLSRVLVQLQRLLQGCDTGDCDTRDKELAAGRALEGGVQSSPSRRRAAVTS